MKCRYQSILAIAALAAFPVHSRAAITLGTAANFDVLAGTAIANTGPSIFDGGDIGVSPGFAITGFPPGVVTPPYTEHTGDAVAVQAQSDLAKAYAAAAGLAPNQDLTGQNLGGLVLTPGVYSFSSSAQLTGILTLNDLGDANAQFVFQIDSTLTTAPGSSVVTINGGATPSYNDFFQVGSSATLNAGTNFEGHILALTSITLDTGANILDGSALAENGAVTLDTNNITNFVPANGTGGSGNPTAAPSPTPLLGGLAMFGMLAFVFHSKQKLSPVSDSPRRPLRLQ